MPQLKRSLGLLECTLIGVGVMLGAGIYALVGQAATLAGNVVWLSFLLAGFVAACTGLSYAELSSFIPKAGGAYYFTNRAFGGLVAFWVSWQLVIGIAIAASTVALGFAGYLNVLVETQVLWMACLLVAAAAALLIYGIEQSARVAGICTSLEVLGLVIIIAVGVPNLGSIDLFELAGTGASGVVAAGALVFFAYIGFEDIAQLAEETRNPTRVIPVAILLSILITTVLYVLVAVAAVSVIGWERLGASESPLADVAAVALGHQAFLGLSTIALFSTANTVLILIMSAARLLYGMAEDGKMPGSLAKIHPTRKSPYTATIAVATISLLVIISLQHIAIVASVSNFSLLAAFVVVNADVIALRWREPNVPRPFRIPICVGRLPVIPVLGIITSIFLLSQVGMAAILIGLGIWTIGIVIYFLRL